MEGSRMKILIINPPHPAIGSRIPREHLPPLGLLSLGGPLIDARHETKLLDAEFGPMSIEEILAEVRQFGPHAVLLGHSGSTSAHPIAIRIAQAVRAALPHTWIVYGGVFPTYHWREILEDESTFDVIVRGEGEETIVRLIAALENSQPLEQITGIAFRFGTQSAPGRAGTNTPAVPKLSQPPPRQSFAIWTPAVWVGS
jgi:anaerobic magnesium-protoporphyrin IX monomethyl ester cyclase